MEDKKVNVFSTPTCPFCKKTKEFLKQKGVEYIDHDVTSDKGALEEMRRLTEGGLSVPVIQIGDEVIVGFDKGKIEELLG